MFLKLFLFCIFLNKTSSQINPSYSTTVSSTTPEGPEEHADTASKCACLKPANKWFKSSAASLNPEDTSSCSVENSPITPKLEALFKKYSSFDNAASQLLEISRDYSLFNSYDTYLSANIFKNFINSLTNQTFEIITNILKIDEDVLKESQLKFCGTDGWLDNVMDTVWIEDENIFVSENLVVSSDWVYTGGILTKRISDDQVVLYGIETGRTLDDVIETEDLESAFWQSLRLGDSMISVFNIYFTKKMFPQEGETVIDDSSDVFGMGPSESYLSGLRCLIYKYDNTTFTKTVTCLYWDRQKLTPSSWKQDGEFQIYPSKSLFVCKFWQAGEFTIAFTTPKGVTNSLEEILTSNANSSEILSRLYQTSSRFNEFNPLDVFLVGQILKRLSGSGSGNDLELLSGIINFLQKIEEGVLETSQFEYNATDSILFYTDVIIQNQNYTSDVQFITDNFVILVFCMNSSFNGFLLLQNGSVESLNTTTNITNLLQYENLDSAFILSSDIKDQMLLDAKIIVNIYFKDVFFIEKKQYVQHQSVTKIYDIILPDYIQYVSPVTLVYNSSGSEDVCSHWSYDVPHEVPGFWQNDSSGQNVSSLTQCNFNHTTHFALLILDEDKYSEGNSLDMITNITLAFSLFGFSSIIVTAVLFRSWRSKTGNKVLLNFVFSGILQIAVFYLSGNFKQYRKVCTFIGSLLHYSVVAQFFWMLIIAVLQFKTLVVTFWTYPPRLLLKSCLFAWGLPLLPVCCVLAADVDSYVSGTVGLCYPSGYGLYFGVWFPICAVIVTNFVIFMCIIHAVLLRKPECTSFGGDEAIYKWERVALLFFLLGLTWIFGFLAEFDNGTVFVYSFCILASLQGFVMFLFFIVLNQRVRDLYWQKIHCVQECASEQK